MFQIYVSFGDLDIWPQIPKQSLFPPNIPEVVANYSPGSPNVRQLIVQLFTKLSPRTENGEQLDNIRDKKLNILQTFGANLAKSWQRFGERLAKCVRPM